jgi:NhaP-type Na+/H+ or K+/H+ antiporter
MTALFSATIKAVAAPPVIALAVGALLGPAALDLLAFSVSEDARMRTMEELCRISVAVSVMGIALRLTPQVLRRVWRSAAILVAAGMIAMWLVSSALAWLLLGGSMASALLLGAILTPTDPVVASSIVTGKLAVKNVPERLRALISLESGANDGIAYAFVFLPLLALTAQPEGIGLGWLRLILWDVLGAVLIGAALGYVAALLLRKAERIGTVEHPALLTASFALTLATLGALKLIGTDGILGVFAAGLTLSLHTGAHERVEERDFQEGGEIRGKHHSKQLKSVKLQWEARLDLGGRGLVLSALVLLVRRPLAVLLLGPLLGAVRGRREIVFVGWFGPLGVSAVFYVLLADSMYRDTTLWAAASLVIASSIVVHGLSAAPLAKWLGKGER